VTWHVATVETMLVSVTDVVRLVTAKVELES